MGFHEKLTEYFEERKITKRSVAEKIGFGEVMTGRYLRTNKPNYEFLLAVKKAFPDIDLNYLFDDGDKSENALQESTEKYQNPEGIIDKVEYHLKELRKVLAQNSHN